MENSTNHLRKYEKYLFKGKYVKALFYILKYLETNSDDAEGWSNLALVYYFMGKFPEAIDATKKALNIEPHLKIAFNYLFLAYDQEKKFEEALELIIKYIDVFDLEKGKSVKLKDLFPSLQFPYNPIYNYDFQMEDNSEFIKLYIRLNSRDHKLAKRKYADSYVLDGNFIIMHKILREISDATNIILFHFLSDFKFTWIIHSDKKAHVLELITKLFPNSVDSWNSLLSIYKQGLNSDKVITTLKKVLTVKPNSHLHWKELALEYFNVGQYQNALEACNKFLELFPKNEQMIELHKKIQKYL